jgi:heptosyltransferase I
VDWVVEEGFQDIPLMHPGINRVIPIALRRWRKSWIKSLFSGEIFRFIRNLRAAHYDYVIDAQGLLKSAIVGRLARASKRAGLHRHSAREPLASLFYSLKLEVPKGVHAITRTRQLFAKAFRYDAPAGMPLYGLSVEPTIESRPYVVFLHGTTWESKHWPETYWSALAEKAVSQGMMVYLPWGNELEKARANRLKESISEPSNVQVLPRLSLQAMAKVLKGAWGVVGVDTGLSHLAAALECKSVILFGPTDTALTGPLSRCQVSLQSTFFCSPCFRKHCQFEKEAGEVHPPCFKELTPEKVWENML